MEIQKTGLVSNEASHTPWKGLLSSRGCLNCYVIYHLGIVLIFLPCLTLSYLRVLFLLTSCSPIFLSDGNCRFLDMRDDSFLLFLFPFPFHFPSLFLSVYYLMPSPSSHGRASHPLPSHLFASSVTAENPHRIWRESRFA